MGKMVSLTIDGRKVSVPEGTAIVDAAKKAGIVIPVFCYHPKLEPVGMCRQCLVEVGRPEIDRATGEIIRQADGAPKVQFSPKLETACTTPVTEGMVVIGDSPRVQRGRKDILEFLLTSHPLDCPVCDKGGECSLQNLTMEFGPGESRFLYAEKMHLAKKVALGELIFLDRERCIQCARCVRFQDEIVDDPVIGFFQRGRALEIVTYSEPGFNSIWSGNATDICPVGALTTADFRFGARPWELNAAASICPHCPVGCNLTLNTRREAAASGDWVVKRVMPRQNEGVNEIWICDKGRFAYHFAESEERLQTPLVRKDGALVPTSWEAALELVATHFRQAGEGLLSLVGGRLSNEDLFNIKKLTEGVGGKTYLYSDMAGGDLVAQIGPGPGTNFAELGSNTAILVVASDLEQEAPIWWLRIKQAAERGATLIIANPRFTKLERYAQHKIRYSYGDEAAVILAMANSLSAKRPHLPDAIKKLAHSPELLAAAKAFAEAENGLILYGSEGIGLQTSQTLAQVCANLALITGHTGRSNNGLIAVWQRVNEQGAWDIGLRPATDLKQELKTSKALYVVAADPTGDDPELAETSDFLVVQDLFLTGTAKLADVVLPAQAFTEREGSYTSGERRVQRFYPALPARPDCLADFTIAARIGRLLELDLEDRSASRVMDRIAADLQAYKEVSYARLSEVVEQWPIIGRGDVYYGGTTYENRQGLGVQLPLSVQPNQQGGFPLRPLGTGLPPVRNPAGLSQTDMRGMTPAGQPVTLSWQEPARLAEVESGLLAVPITRLYDRGRTVATSWLLQQRLSPVCVVLNPAEAEKLGIAAGERVNVELKNAVHLAIAQLDEDIPTSVALVPRSVGIPVYQPQPVHIRAVEKASV
jgi:NADH-quinone oxidoreductase subunit G